MNKKIIISLSVIGAIAAIAVGGTIAYFSDTETSTGNTFTSGTLDLSVNTENPVVSEVTLSNVKPTDSFTYTYNLKNEGSVDAGHLYVDVASLVDTEGLNQEPETGVLTDPGELSSNVDVTIYQSDGTTVIWTGTLASLNTLAAPGVGLIEGGAGLGAGLTKTIQVKYSIAPTVGNDIMGDISVFDVVYQLTQD